MDLSIVTTLYRSAPFIREFHRRAAAAAATLAADVELILVNDGSPDDSLEIARSLVAEDPRVRVIDLSRNFGHHRAMMTGLQYARGARVLLLDCDLEEPPELLSDLWSRMDAGGADVVYGVQEARKGGFLERVGGAIFYRLFNLLSTYPMPRNIVTLRLMTARYVRALLLHEEREVFLGGIWAITGFQQEPMAIAKGFRPGTSYTLRRRAMLVVSAITSFSSKPLVMIFHLGLLISGLSFCAALFLIGRSLFFGGLLVGWPSLIVSIWLLGGITIFCLGVIGIYISKVFEEVKRRPYTIVRDVHERRPEAGDSPGKWRF